MFDFFVASVSSLLLLWGMAITPAVFPADELPRSYGSHIPSLASASTYLLFVMSLPSLPCLPFGILYSSFHILAGAWGPTRPLPA